MRGGGSSSRVALLRACPGVVGPVPTRACASVGRRGGAALSRGARLRPTVNCRRDQFSHVVQRFSSGRFLGQWGSYLGPGSSARSTLAVDAAGGRVCARLHARPRRKLLHRVGASPARRMGRPGRSLGEFDFGPASGPMPPGGGLAVGGVCSRLGLAANRIVRCLDGSDPVLGAGPAPHPGASPRGSPSGVVYVADEGNHSRAGALARRSAAVRRGLLWDGAPRAVRRPRRRRTAGGCTSWTTTTTALSCSPATCALWKSGRAPAPSPSYIRAAAVDAAGRVFAAGHERVVAFDPSGAAVCSVFPAQLPAVRGPARCRRRRCGVSSWSRPKAAQPLHQFLTPPCAFSPSGSGAGAPSSGAPPVRPGLPPPSRPDGSVRVTDPRNGLVRHPPGGAGALGVPAAPGSPTASAVGAYASGNGVGVPLPTGNGRQRWGGRRPPWNRSPRSPLRRGGLRR